jgi:hypothetical protein
MINIYQIFYDEATRKKVPSCCIPLDNTSPAELGWYEFLPMLNCLKNQTLNNEDYYGFLSPSFEYKTGISPKALYDIVERKKQDYDVFISNYCWDQTAFFKNAWDQGEYWHPGLKEYTCAFLKNININISLDQLIGYSKNTVASNYIVANGLYWKIWLKLAIKFREFLVETELGRVINEQTVPYAAADNLQRVGVFIQERFATLILSMNKFKTFIFDKDVEQIIFDRIFVNNAINKNILQLCDQFKQYYIETSDYRFYDAWTKLQSTVQCNVPNLR